MRVGSKRQISISTLINYRVKMPEFMLTLYKDQGSKWKLEVQKPADQKVARMF